MKFLLTILLSCIVLLHPQVNGNQENEVVWAKNCRTYIGKMETSAKYGNSANLSRALNNLTNEIRQNGNCELSYTIHKNYISEANKKNNKFNALNSHFMYDLEKINKSSSGAQLTLLPTAMIWIKQLRTDFATFVPEIGLMDIWQNIDIYTKSHKNVMKLCEKIATIQTDVFYNGSILVNEIISEAKDKLEDFKEKSDNYGHPITSEAAGEIKQIVIKMILFAKVAIYRQELKMKVALFRQGLNAKVTNNINAIGIQNEDIIGTTNILRNRFAEIQQLSKVYNGNEVSHAEEASPSQQNSDTNGNSEPQKQNSLLIGGIKQFARAGTLMINALRISDQFEPKISMLKLFDTETKEEDELSEKELDFVNILKEKVAKLNKLVATTKFMSKQFEQMAKDSDNTDGRKTNEFVVNAKNMRAKIRTDLNKSIFESEQRVQNCDEKLKEYFECKGAGNPEFFKHFFGLTEIEELLSNIRKGTNWLPNLIAIETAEKMSELDILK